MLSSFDLLGRAAEVGSAAVVQADHVWADVVDTPQLHAVYCTGAS